MGELSEFMLLVVINVDFDLVFFMIVVFGVMFVVFWLFVWKFIMEGFDKCEKLIVD